MKRILAILLLGAYAVFYARTLSGKSGPVRAAGFLGLMLLLMGLLFYLTVGPVQRRPAVEGKTGLRKTCLKQAQLRTDLRIFRQTSVKPCLKLPRSRTDCARLDEC